MNAITWRGKVDVGAEPVIEEIPADLVERAEEYREKLLEAVAESDEELMEKYFGGEELTIDEIKGAIRDDHHSESTPCCAVPHTTTRVCSRCSMP